MMSNRSVYYFPFEHANQYVDINKNIIADAGFHVKRFSGVFNPINIIQRKRNIVVLNWFEDRPYQNRFTFLRSRLEFIIIFLQMIIIKMFAHKIIWVRHNFKPHNRDNRPFTHKLSCWALGLIADDVVTLENTKAFNSNIVPHPLYRDDEVIISSSKTQPEAASSLEYMFFGTIKPYKRLHQLLMLWPQTTFLKIVGKCQDQNYVEEINSIIERRGLDVEWLNDYVSDEYLDELLAKTKFVFLPHSDGAMISSGTFYQAINFGVNIVCFDSYFARDKKAKHDFVHIVSEANFTENFENLVAVPKAKIMEEAVIWYGRSTVSEAWSNILIGKK